MTPVRLTVKTFIRYSTIRIFEFEFEFEFLGIKFQSENEEELKEKLDFSEASAFVKLPPYASSLGNEFPGLRALADLRPNIGCKTLIARNMHRLIPAAINDMGYVPSTRHRITTFQLNLLFIF